MRRKPARFVGLVALLLMLAGVLSACGGGGATSPATTTAPTTPEAPSGDTAPTNTLSPRQQPTVTPDPKVPTMENRPPGQGALPERQSASALGGDFRPDSPDLVANTGRVQLVEVFSYD